MFIITWQFILSTYILVELKEKPELAYEPYKDLLVLYDLFFDISLLVVDC